VSMGLICAGCRKRPEELEEYVEAAREEETTPDEYVRENEGTLNSRGEFLCTTCYVAAGMPASPTGWTAPL
jgi:hypothetical protein